MALYVALVLVMPGPTNTLLLSSGLQVGMRGAWRLVTAEALGYVAAVSAWGFFLGALAEGIPWLLCAARLGSSIYILVLALKMWTRSRASLNLPVGPVRFRELFLATLLNPKALLFASALFPIEAFQSAGHFASAMAAFLMVLVPIGIGWSFFGSLLMSRRAFAAHTSTFLRGASLVLLGFSGALMYSALGNR